MPHCYSAEAWQRRVDRALARGFIRPLPRGQRYVQVEAGLHSAVKSAYHSLRWHRVHDRMTYSTHHHGRLASLHAFETGVICTSEFETASRTHGAAGRMKHNVSRARESLVGEEFTDAVFEDDPWAGWAQTHAAPGRDAAVSRDGTSDKWAEWSSRRQRQDDASARSEAIESRTGYDVRVLLDVLVNEMMRDLVLQVRTVVGHLERLEEDSLLCGGGVVEDRSDDVDEEQWDAQERDHQHDAVLVSHAEVRRRFLEEWGRYERFVRNEAKDLAVDIEQGDDEWWNEDLQTAERVEGYASLLSGACTCVDGAVVANKLMGYYCGVGECDAAEEVDGLLLKIGMKKSSVAPAGAWALLLGRVGSQEGDEGEEGDRGHPEHEGHCREGSVGEVSESSGGDEDALSEADQCLS